MLNNGDLNATIAEKDAVIWITPGFYSGGGVAISQDEQAKIVPENIKTGVEILGQTGTFTQDADATAADIKQDKTAYVNGAKVTGSYLWQWQGAQVSHLQTVYNTSYSLSSTTFTTWTPSTTASTIKSTVNVTTASMDLVNYDYLLRWQVMTEVKYDEGTSLKTAPLFEGAEIWQCITRRPSSLVNAQADNFNGNFCATLFTAPFLDYVTSASTYTHSFTYSNSYGIYPAATAATFSSTTSNNPNVTIKSPTISARCSTTYFSTTMAGKVDEDNSTITIKGDLYRVPVGCAMRSIYQSMIDLYNEGRQ